jgi:putative oxidoreductase
MLRILKQSKYMTSEIYFISSDETRRMEGAERGRMTASSKAISCGLEAKGIAKGTVALAGRFLFVLIFLFAAPNHFSKQSIAYAASQGVPLASVAVPLSGILAMAGGLSVLLGYRARVGAWLIALFLVPVTFMMHKFWAVHDPMMSQMQMIMFMKNLSILGGALLITQFGAGPLSLDARRSR